ncbi:MAG: MFS transporter [Paracoccaceae bacterium]
MAQVSLQKRVWGWMAFDWATQPFYTLLLTFIFGPYFAAVAANYFLGTGLDEARADANAQSLWSLGQTITGLAIAFTAPVLGAFADSTGRRMPWIIAFSLLYVVGTCGIWYLLPDGSFLWGTLISFGIAMVGAEYALIFVNAILPSLGNDEEVGRISGSGAAVGYWGGVVSLFIMLLFFAENESGKTLIGLKPLFGLDPENREGTRFVGPFTALWYLIFMIPFFMWVKEAPGHRAASASVSGAFSDLGKTLKNVLKRNSLAAFLASSMFYRDALNALYGFGGVYATLVLNWTIIQIGVFGIVGAITAAVVTFVGGRADRAFGPRPVIITTIWVLIAVCSVIVGMSRDQIFGVQLAPNSTLPDVIFYVCGAAIGGAGGALYAASRSMMVRHANPERPTEAFGLFALSGKATAFLAPALIGAVTYLTGSARLGVSPVIVLFVVGLILLRWVHPKGDKETWFASQQSSV